MQVGLQQPGLLRLLTLFVALSTAVTMTSAHTVDAAGLGTSLSKALAEVDSNLANVIQSIADAVADISDSLRTIDFDHGHAGSTNSFGDDQIQADIHADELIFKHLRGCPAVESASSEEQSDILPMGGKGYTVAFDPLDGSSIFDANFAVGSIFGVWPGSTPLGQTGRHQAAAAYSVYGPRTLLVVAVPVSSNLGNLAASAALAAAPAGHRDLTANGHHDDQQQCNLASAAVGAAGCLQESPADAYDVLEFILSGSQWHLRKEHVKLVHRNNIAPANIRAAAGNAAYQALLNKWITSGCKLRYSGGMVPDVHHILAKGGGVFCNPKSEKAPAKLRLLYECAPLALIVEAAGGVSHDGQGSILDLELNDTGSRSIIALGSKSMVEQCLEAMRGA